MLWNRGNASAEYRAAPSSDTPPAALSAEERQRVKQAAAAAAAAAAATAHCRSDGNGADAHLERAGSVPPSVDVPLSAEAHHPEDEALLRSLEKVVLARRSTKVFDPTRPVSKELMHRMLAATVRAPTANNLQPWHAIVVHDEEQKQRLCRAALGQRQVITAPYTVVFAGDTEGERYAPQVLEQGLDNGSLGADYGPQFLRSVYYHLHGGPLQSMAIAKSALSSWYSHRTGTPLLSVPVSRAGYAWKQTMIPASVFLYLATAAGLDSCVLEGIDEAAVRAVVGLPERFTIPVIVSVGYAAPGDGLGGPRRPRSARFAVSHLVRWSRY